MLTLRQIEAFKAVMEVGTVLGAAEAMHVSQSAVSHLLSDLEADLGYRLFERRKGKLSPRREAQQLYAEVERSFTGLRRIHEAARRIGRREGGRLRIATLPGGCQSLLPRATARLLANHPRVWLNVQSRSPQQVIEEVARQQADIGITTLPVDHPEVEVALRQSMILSDNSAAIFFTRPFSAFFMGLTAIVVATVAWQAFAKPKGGNNED